MKIFYKQSPSRDGKAGYLWAWEESYNVNVWGWQPTLYAVKEQAKRMLVEHELILVAL